METLGSRLKKAREKMRFTQQDIAKTLGISNGTLSGYERNYRDPDTETLKRLAELYETTTDYLTGRNTTKVLKEDDEKALELIAELKKLSKEDQEYLEGLIKRMPKE